MDESARIGDTYASAWNMRPFTRGLPFPALQPFLQKRPASSSRALLAMSTIPGPSSSSTRWAAAAPTVIMKRARPARPRVPTYNLRCRLRTARRRSQRELWEGLRLGVGIAARLSLLRASDMPRPLPRVSRLSRGAVPPHKVLTTVLPLPPPSAFTVSQDGPRPRAGAKRDEPATALMGFLLAPRLASRDALEPSQLLHPLLDPQARTYVPTRPGRAVQATVLLRVVGAHLFHVEITPTPSSATPIPSLARLKLPVFPSTASSTRAGITSPRRLEGARLPPDRVAVIPPACPQKEAPAAVLDADPPRRKIMVTAKLQTAAAEATRHRTSDVVPPAPPDTSA